MTNVAPIKTNNSAIQAVKNRFVRIPSKNSNGTFRDIDTGIAQSDPAILKDFYRRNGGKDELEPVYLLGCLEWAYGEKFVPNAPAVLGNGFVNLWKAPEILPSGQRVTKDQVAPFIDFLSRWFPDDEERDYFGWWLAMSVRHQEEKIISTPLLRSEHGIGKGFMAETLLPGLLGRTSVALCHLKDVVGDFNETVEGKTLLVVDEVYRSKKSTTDALKGIQANSTLTLRRKHLPVITIDNYINFIITSNDHIPLVLEKGDRRFWIPAFIRHKVNQAETDSFLNDVFKPWLLSGGFQLVRDYLEQVNLNKYRATAPAPMTESKQEILGFTTTDKLEDVITEIVDANKVLTVQWIKTEYGEDFEHGLSDVAIANVLLNIGCKQRRTKSCRYYITPFGFESGLSLESTGKELDSCMPKGSF